ncbi:retrovirus-related pol polyprotein from transposon TNT 1-94 [Tanacetum coccineum]
METRSMRRIHRRPIRRIEDIASGTLLCVTSLPKNIAIKAKKVSNSKVNTNRSKPVTSHPTPTNEQGVESSNSVTRQKSKDTKMKNRVLKNTNAKSSTAHVIQLVLWIVDSGCSKHITGNLQLVTAITGYGDYVQGNLTICHVYYVEGLRHNLFSVRQFCDGDLEVAFCSNTCYVRNLEGDDLLTGSRDSNLYIIFISEMTTSSPAFYAKLGIVHQSSIARTPQQNGIVERRNLTLVEAAQTMIIFSKAPELLWAEAIATACFTQNRSIVHIWYNKTPYELIRGRKPNIQYFYMFGSLCYSTNDRDDLGKMKLKADIGIFIGYSESSRGFCIYNRRTNMETIYVKFDELIYMASECNNLEPRMNCSNFQDSSKDSQSIPSKLDLDNLFGPLYEEYYATSSQEVLENSVANTLDNEHTSSSSSIVVEED